jgi:hypothetical protein
MVWSDTDLRMSLDKTAASEHLEQAALFQWLAEKYPYALAFAIPNGGLRNVKVALKLKAEGVKPGVPDLFIAEPRGANHGLFIEMKKSHGGRMTKEQAKWQELLRKRGYCVEVCYGFKAAQDMVDMYLGPMHEELSSQMGVIKRTVIVP